MIPPVIRALSLQGVSLDLVAVGVDALALGGAALHPLLATLEGKVAAQPPAPLEVLGHGVVGGVPARVLHQRHGDPAVDGVLGVGPRHRLVLEQPLLPVGQRRALLPLVLQLRPRQLRKIRLLFSKQML